MSTNEESDIGLRIRQIRQKRGLSLRALAELSDLSPNAISRIERGENSPTVSTLLALTNALGVEMVDFFQDAEDQVVTVYVKHDHRLATTSPGILIESLGLGIGNQQLVPFLVTLQPGEGNRYETLQHPGDEFIFCISGEIEYFVGEESYHLQPGDSLVFKANQLHSFHNIGDVPAVYISVIEAVDDDDSSRRQHLGIRSINNLGPHST